MGGVWVGGVPFERCEWEEYGLGECPLKGAHGRSTGWGSAL